MASGSVSGPIKDLLVRTFQRKDKDGGCRNTKILNSCKQNQAFFYSHYSLRGNKDAEPHKWIYSKPYAILHHGWTVKYSGFVSILTECTILCIVFTQKFK